MSESNFYKSYLISLELNFCAQKQPKEKQVLHCSVSYGAAKESGYRSQPGYPGVLPGYRGAVQSGFGAPRPYGGNLQLGGAFRPKLQGQLTVLPLGFNEVRTLFSMALWNLPVSKFQSTCTLIYIYMYM